MAEGLQRKKVWVGFEFWLNLVAEKKAKVDSKEPK